MVAIYKAYALLALTTLFWAGNSIAGKLAVGHASPMIIVTLRWGSVMVALYLFQRKQIAADWSVIRPRLRSLLMLGALGFTVFSVALYYALVHTTAINTSILQGGMPLFVFLASFLFYSSRIGLGQAVGFILSFIGVIAIAVRGEFANLIALSINFGDALMLVAIIAYGVYTAALRSKPKVHWTSLMFILCLGATLFLNRMMMRKWRFRRRFRGLLSAIGQMTLTPMTKNNTKPQRSIMIRQSSIMPMVMKNSPNKTS